MNLRQVYLERWEDLINLYNLLIKFSTDALNTNGLLNTIQFTFTAIFTLLIPLLVILFEKRDEFNSLDKKLSRDVSQIKLVFLDLILVCFSFLLWEINPLLALIFIFFGFIFLTYQTLHIINFILDKDSFRVREIRKSKNEEVVDYFQEYFLSEITQPDSGLNTRTQNKIQGKEQKMLTLLSLKIDRGFHKQDYQFVLEVLEILNQGFDGISKYNLFYYDLTGKPGLLFITKLFEWHYRAWKAEERFNDQDLYLIDHNILDLLGRIQEFCLINLQSYWNIYISELEKHLRRSISSDKKIHELEYVQTLHIWNMEVETRIDLDKVALSRLHQIEALGKKYGEK